VRESDSCGRTGKFWVYDLSKIEHADRVVKIAEVELALNPGPGTLVLENPVKLGEPTGVPL
jgi:hypothetical protein